jgi:hypothetical protein
MRPVAAGHDEPQGSAVTRQPLAHQSLGIDRHHGGVEAGTGVRAKTRPAHGRPCPPPLYHRRMSPDETLGEPQSFPPPPPPAGGFIDTWRHVMSDPRGFFTDMPQVGGLQEPLVFLAICAAVNALGTLLFGWSLAAAAGVFVSVIVGAFVAAAVLTLVAQHLFEGRAGFEPMFRVVAYASAPIVFLWLPLLWVFALLYSWYLEIRGVERVNDFGPTPAVLTVAVTTGVLLLVGAALRGWHL